MVCKNEGWDRSKGGFSGKLHAACDALGKPIRFLGTAGQRFDDMKALDLIDNQKMSALIADKGYDAHDMVDAAKGVHAQVVVPPRYPRRNPREYDQE